MIAWRNRHRRIILEIDSMKVVSMLETWKYMNKEWEVIIQHTYRKGNKLVDSLASMAYDQPLQCFVFYSPPDTICNLLNADANGVVTPRLMVG
ncbi:hypothetical protein ES332_A10G218100v1 [Gossypium tomentosum]|uniref:RNase H type-1 domain-containing protein n=1 Tax=Gossypium tomentosum TaxID=34277 RepID=A0A5D2NY59_GOSTO|nr:hypothetical protein ES332_A10G218100v1 [Gossypium tomentosum]